MTVTQTGGMTFTSSVDAKTLTLTDTTGTVAVQGDLTLTTGLTTANQDYNVSITGTTNTIAGDTNFINTGTVTIGDTAGDTTTFAGGLGLTGNGTNPTSVSLAGTINTTNTRMDIGAVTLADTTILDTGDGGVTGILNVGVVTSDDNALTLDSGSTAGATIAVTSMANILGGFTIRDAGGLATIGALGSGTAGAVIVTDSTSGVTFSAAVAASTITISDSTAAQTITFTGNVTTTGVTSALAGTGAYNITLNGAANVFTGDVQLANTGTNTFGDAIGDSFTFNGGLDSDNGETIINAGTFTTSNDQIDLDATTVNNTVSIISGSAAQNLGDVTLADGVTLTLQTGGAGAITVISVSGTDAGAVSNLTINNTGFNEIGAIDTDIDTVTVTQTGGMTFTSSVDAKTLTLTDTTGTVAVQGDLTLTTGLTTANQDYNVSITGTDNTIAGDTNFINTGTVTIGDAAGDTTTFTGGLGLTGNGTNPTSVSLAGTINTTNTRMDIGAVTLAAATILDTGDGGVTGILNVGVVTSDDNALTLDSGSTAGATIAVTSMANILGGFTIRDAGGLATIGALGSGTAGAVIVTDSTSGVTFSAAVAASTITISDSTAAQTITFTGNVTTTGVTSALAGTGAYNITLNGAANVFTGDVQLANTGINTFGDAIGDSFTFNGGLDSDDGATIINAGTFTTSNDQIDLDATTINNTVSIISGSAAQNLGDVTLADGITLTLQNDGAGAITATSVSGTDLGDASNLVINNTGSVNVTGNIDTDIETITITSTGGATFAGTVNAENLTITNGALSGTTTNWDLSGYVSIGANATLNATTGTITVFGNWTNSGTFSSQSGTVKFDGAGTTSNITGISSFYNFNCETGDKTLKFAIGDDNLQTITNIFTLTGSDGNLININSSEPGTMANINVEKAIVSYVSVKDSNNLGNIIYPQSSDEAAVGSTNRWFFAGVNDWVWIGKTDNSWTVANNWSTGSTPGSGSDIIISASGYNLKINSANQTGNNIIVDSNATLYVDGFRLNATETFTNYGIITNTVNGKDINLTAKNLTAGTITNTVNGKDINLTASNKIILSENITASNGNIEIDGGTTGTKIMQDEDITVSSAGGNITITGDIDGSDTIGSTEILSLNSQTGSVLVENDVEEYLEKLIIVQSGGTTFDGSVNTPTITIDDTTGTVSFNGEVNVANFNTANQDYSVAINAGGTITNAVTFSNTGGITLGNDSSDSITFTNGIVNTASTTTIAGTVSTAENDMIFNSVQLASATKLLSGNADITMGQITGANIDLTLDSGTGNITATNVNNVIGNLTITGNNVAITEKDNITQGGAWDINGSGTFLAAGYDIILNNSSNDFTGSVTTTGKNITLNDANSLILGNTTASENVILNVVTAVTQSLGTKITADGMLIDGDADYTLTNSDNNINTLAASKTKGSIEYAENTAFSIGTVGSVDGINLKDKLTLSSSNTNISQTKTITVGSLEVKGGGTFNFSGAPTNVTGDLTLPAGLIALGNNNLTVNGLIKGVNGGSSNANFSSNNMILTNGSGKVKKGVSGEGDYFIPIGTDSTYSPIKFNFAKGSFGPNSYVEASAVAEKYSGNNSNTNGLNRYWITTAENISDFNVTVTCYYDASEVFGSEASIRGVMYINNAETIFEDKPVNHSISGRIAGNSLGVFTGTSAPPPSPPVDEPEPTSNDSTQTNINDGPQTSIDQDDLLEFESSLEKYETKSETELIISVDPDSSTSTSTLESFANEDNQAAQPNRTVINLGDAIVSMLCGEYQAAYVVAKTAEVFKAVESQEPSHGSNVGNVIVKTAGVFEAVQSQEPSYGSNVGNVIVKTTGVFEAVQSQETKNIIFIDLKQEISDLEIKETLDFLHKINNKIKATNDNYEQKKLEDESTKPAEQSDSNQTQNNSHNNKHPRQKINNEPQSQVSIDDLYSNKLEKQKETYMDDILGDVDYSNIEYLTKGKHDIFKSDFDKALDQFIAA